MITETSKGKGCVCFQGKVKKCQESYGVPSGPVIRAFMTSTRVSSTFKNIDESHATGRLVERIASYFSNIIKTPLSKLNGHTSLAIARDRLGISELANIRASLLK